MRQGCSQRMSIGGAVRRVGRAELQEVVGWAILNTGDERVN